MKASNKIAIVNIDHDLFGSLILGQLEAILLGNPDIESAELQQDLIPNAKCELNLVLDVVINIGIGVASAAIYDYIKKIWKSTTERDRKLKLSIKSEDNDVIIEIQYDQNLDDVSIIIRK